MGLLTQYKKLARKANELKIDAHIHMIVGIIVAYITFYLTGHHLLAILGALTVGIVKEVAIDMKFNVKDACDYGFGAVIFILGTLI